MRDRNNLITIYDYSYYEQQSKDKYNRKCIDGSIVGGCKCVGYCEYDGHKGFLTEKHKNVHKCEAKECVHYIPKTNQKKEKTYNKHPLKANEKIVQKASESVSKYDGFKILKAEKDVSGVWLIKYITITNSYSLNELKNTIETAIGKTIELINLNYDFLTATELIYGL